MWLILSRLYRFVSWGNCRHFSYSCFRAAKNHCRDGEYLFISSIILIFCCMWNFQVDTLLCLAICLVFFLAVWSMFISFLIDNIVYFVVSVCKEALEVLTVALVLNPKTLESLTKDKMWHTFIIDLLLLCKNRYDLQNWCLICKHF
jgi:hypothetical protein